MEVSAGSQQTAYIHPACRPQTLCPVSIIRWNPTWTGWSGSFMRSPPAAEWVLSRDEVVRGERTPSSGRGRAAQLRGSEADLPGAGAWPREAVLILLPGKVKRVPGARWRLTDSRDVMITGEVIRRRDVLTVHWQSLSRVSGGLRAGVHTVLQVWWLFSRPRGFKPPGACSPPCLLRANPWRSVPTPV